MLLLVQWSMQILIHLKLFLSQNSKVHIIPNKSMVRASTAIPQSLRPTSVLLRFLFPWRDTMTIQTHIMETFHWSGPLTNFRGWGNYHHGWEQVSRQPEVMLGSRVLGSWLRGNRKTSDTLSLTRPCPLKNGHTSHYFRSLHDCGGGGNYIQTNTVV